MTHGSAILPKRLGENTRLTQPIFVKRAVLRGFTLIN